MQFIPTYEEYNAPNMKEYDPKAFTKFEEEVKQDVSQAILNMETQHIEFSGMMQKGKKEGRGGYTYQGSTDFYYGQW